MLHVICYVQPSASLAYAATGDDGYQVKCGPPRCRILSLASQPKQLDQRFTLKSKPKSICATFDDKQFQPSTMATS